MRRIRKISVGVDYKDCFCLLVGQPTHGGNKVDCIVYNKEKEMYDIFIKDKDGVVQFWKDFRKDSVISTEDFIV